MSKNVAEQKPKWRTRDGRVIDVSEMESDHLQRALWTVQRRELDKYHEMMKFVKLREALEDEAEERGIKLLDLDQGERAKDCGIFFKAKRQVREATKEGQ